MTPEQKLILAVDDTPLNISVITGALKDTYKIKVATSGAKALVIAVADEKPDLILLVPGFVVGRFSRDPHWPDLGDP